MALIVNIEITRCNNAGIVFTSSREIVLWGRAAATDTVSRIEMALQDVKQVYNGQMMSQADLIRDVCEQFAPGCWDFVSRAGAIRI